jgi:aminoglycoside phosphotransferase (APT) family kinase protein
VEKDQEWLPRLAPHLPLEIPVPVAKGAPSEGYPWHWAIHRWLEGENATTAYIADMRRAAVDLAEFIAALQRIDATGGPVAEPGMYGRGIPLRYRDVTTRQAIAGCEDMIDRDAVIDAWEDALQAPDWHGEPVWIHADLQGGNLLVRDGRLSAVIDWGGLVAGDPAGDMTVAWYFLTAETREIFREVLGVDDATWVRGRGLALSVALLVLPYYRHTNPVLVGLSQCAIAEVLADHGRDN